MTKYPTKATQGKKVYSSWHFQEGYSSWQGRHRGRGMKLGCHLALSGPGLYSLKMPLKWWLPSSTPPPKGSVAFLYSSTSWGPSVQLHEPKWDISHLNPNMTLYHHSHSLTVNARKNSWLTEWQNSTGTPKKWLQPALMTLSSALPGPLFQALSDSLGSSFSGTSHHLLLVIFSSTGHSLV